MIWLRKEGQVQRRGLSLMVSPHYQAVFMWGTYNYRFRFGIGYSRFHGHFYLIRNFWTRSDDIYSEMMMKGLYTQEQLNDWTAKKISESSKTRGYTK